MFLEKAFLLCATFHLVICRASLQSFGGKNSIRSRRSVRSDLSWTKNNGNGLVLVYDQNFSPQEVKTLFDASREILRYSCIDIKLFAYYQFLNAGGSNSKLFRNFVFISRNSWRGCYADIGMNGGMQKMNLDPVEGCTLKKASVMHEMIHSLGYDHEQNRPDRDRYVYVNFANVARGKENNFNIKPYFKAVGPYDYSSIMHYGSLSFSVGSNNPTIVSRLAGYKLTPFASPVLSATDKMKIKYITGCKSSF